MDTGREGESGRAVEREGETERETVALWQLPLLPSTTNEERTTPCTAPWIGPLHGQPGLFFLDGIGGVGNTFLYKVLLAQDRSQGDIALACASSGLRRCSYRGEGPLMRVSRFPLTSKRTPPAISTAKAT